MAVTVSVVIPVYNSAAFLAECLGRIARSETPPHECVVVDDGSTDDSPAVARSFGAKLISTGGRRGPAHARNLGARTATGDVVFFIDADVCVYPDSVRRVMEDFAEDPELDAVIGSYDEYPQYQDFLSQYRNLMHCFVHQNGRRKASTFWSGCGAIRRSLFLEHGGFSESYQRPAIEDIELGYRLTRAGHKVILDKSLEVKHLKRWTFWNLLKTDIFDRGIPWTELILRDRCLPNDLNVQVGQRLSVALAFLIVGAAAGLAIYWQGYFLTPLFTTLFFLLSCFWVESAQPRSRTVTLSVAGIVAAIVALAYTHHMLGLIPLVLLACLLLYMRYHYYSDQKRRKKTGLMLGFYLLVGIAVTLTYLPGSLLAFGFISMLFVLVVLNRQFYLFLARRGRLFALAAIPFHMLFHFYSGLAFLAGAAHYYWEHGWRGAQVAKR